MEKKQAPRHEKMYSNSPRLERNEESGHMGISKGEKKSAEVNSGTDAIAEHDGKLMEMMGKHSMERLEMHHNHEREIMKHHQTKAMAMSKPAETGAEEIAQVEKE